MEQDSNQSWEGEWYLLTLLPYCTYKAFNPVSGAQTQPLLTLCDARHYEPSLENIFLL